jgi:hypothetical protein
MSGGQQINTGQGTITYVEGDLTPHGLQINSAQGFIIALGGDGNPTLSGEASTGAAGTPGNTHVLPLRSRKVGGGSASAALSGNAITGDTGILTPNKSFALTGRSITSAQGALSYRGQATLSWNAVTTNSDGSPASDIAGYMILHGTSPTVYNGADTVQLNGQFNTSYVYGGLLPGMTHYFVVQCRDNANNFSGNSLEVSKAY